MTETAVLLCFAVATGIHVVLCAVVGVFAYYRVNYLALAWILGICAVVLAVVGCFSADVAAGHPEPFHPAMMWMMLTGIFLQSIYTFGFSMPGFLQWERMWRYAMPIILLGAISGLFGDKWWSRILVFLVGVGYIANIYLLPRRLAKRTPIPGYLKGYTLLLTLSYAFYIYVSMNYKPLLLCAFVVCFTLQNFYLVFLVLMRLGQHLSQPVVSEEGASEGKKEAESRELADDFNERNLARYQTVERWMHENKTMWTDNSFNRDVLCREVGINRQLLLQCLRSQGHNNIHEYLMLYRIKELKKLIVRGEITQVSESVDVGFGAVKTARQCFERVEGMELDEFIRVHRRN
mgnify:CR=1 FL=1